MSCTFTLAGTVPGLGLSTVNGGTGNNTTTMLTVAGASGTIYINGTVQANAVLSGTTKAYALTLTIKDSDNAVAATNGTWTASTAPKIANPGSQAMEPYNNLSLALEASCPNGGCTWEATIDPAPWFGISVSSSGVVSASFMPPGTYVLKVTVTDSDDISDTAFIPLRVTNFSLTIPTQNSARPSSGTKVVTLDVADLITPAADGYTYALSNKPTWLTIDATTGLLTATLTPTSPTGSYYNIAVTVRSMASSSSTVATTFRWNIS